jgi:hypothetical protein
MCFGMPSRPLCRWVLWVLALWVSVLTPLAALGCVQACERAWGDGRCCASETTRPCSNHPCSCEPCPVCSAPAPSPLWAKAEEPKPLAPASVGILTIVFALPRHAAQPTPLPEPPFIPPDTDIKWGHPHRAPPVLRLTPDGNGAGKPACRVRSHLSASLDCCRQQDAIHRNRRRLCEIVRALR